MEWALGLIVGEHVRISVWLLRLVFWGRISKGFVWFFATSIGWVGGGEFGGFLTFLLPFFLFHSWFPIH